MTTVTRLLWTELPAAPGVDVDVYWHVHDGDHEHHDHDFFEFAVVLEGRGVHEVLDGRRPLGAGDAFTIRPGSWHAFVECQALLVASCCVRTRLLDRELLWLAEEPSLRLLLWPGAAAGNGIVHVKLSEAQLRDCDASLRLLAAPPAELPGPYRLAQLLLALHSLAAALEPDQLDDATRLASAPAAVVEALHLMESDLTRSWTLGELAAEVALSPAYLSRRFREAVGRPPMAHLSKLRAEAAAIRLLRGSEPVAAVGAAVGWGDPNYFSRRFRAHFGTTPTAYRRRLTWDRRQRRRRRR
jgi:AraC-like DNA-binding protein/mannose-6-phosphate isomerase-like protein (cupin superfamily)